MGLSHWDRSHRGAGRLDPACHRTAGATRRQHVRRPSERQFWPTPPSWCSHCSSLGRLKSAPSKRRLRDRLLARPCCFSASLPWSAGQNACAKSLIKQMPVYSRRCCSWSLGFCCPRCSTPTNALLPGCKHLLDRGESQPRRFDRSIADLRRQSPLYPCYSSRRLHRLHRFLGAPCTDQVAEKFSGSQPSHSNAATYVGPLPHLAGPGKPVGEGGRTPIGGNKFRRNLCLVPIG